jgi:Leucine-rich repeat (LRR) protein
MVKLYIFLFMNVFSLLQSQKTYLSENFDYPAGAFLNANGWYTHSGSSNPIAVTSEGLSWTKTAYIGSGKGRAAAVVNTGNDENRPFTSWADSLNLYASFLVRANGEVSTTNSGYFFHFVQYAAPTAPVFTATGSSFRARVYSAPGSSASKFKIGITFNSNTLSDGGQSADLNVGETYFVVAKYTFVSGADNDLVSLYVFKDGDKIDVEPATPTAGPFGRTGTTIAPDLSSIQGVALRQFAANQNITVDGIYVRNHWNMTTEGTGNACAHPDFAALMALYHSTNGQNWTNNTGWKEGAAGTSCDPCNHNGQPWYGLRCENGRVTCLDLDGVVSCGQNPQIPKGNNLIGIIPDSINFITKLKYFSLSDNQLSGSIPNLNFPNLQVLNLYRNQLTGTIPNFDLPNLQSLSLSSNQLTGTIPNFNMPNLQFLSLYLNQLSGPIPDFALPNLRNLVLHYNRLTGTIPNFNLPNLQILLLTENQLTGTIPNFNLPNLITISIGSNQLTGTIPNFNLPNLQNLYLSRNQLSGAIPNFNFPNLTSISYDNNKIDQLPKFSFSNLKRDTTGFVLGMRAQSNRLSFDDILPNIQYATTATFIYSPQDSFYVDTTLLAEIGKPISIDLGIDAAITDNIYKWYKKGILIDSIVGNNKRIFNNIQATDAGVWTCRVTNTRAPLLTLQSRKITIQTALCTHPDYAGLMALYDSTSGPGWINKTGWDAGKAGTSCDPCNFNGQPWYGIQCENGRVTCIDLDGILSCDDNSVGNNLRGTIPDFEIQNLKTLVLSGNQLSGSIPNFNLPNLQNIWLNGNQLSGPIPNFNLPNLRILNFSNNQLSGQIPNLNLPNLQHLSLEANQLSGSIPLFNLPKLETLSFEKNQLSGAIPNLNLPSLGVLTLGNNQLSGSIPNFNNFNLPNLQYLWLHANQLSGSIPNFNLTNLREIYVHYNQLSSSIPNFNLPNLYIFRADGNLLSGCIPPSFKKYCDSILVDDLFNAGKKIKVIPGINLFDNPLLPWQGDFSKLCATDGSLAAQRGAPCNNGNPADGSNDVIQADCSCGPEISSDNCLPVFLPKNKLIAYWPFCGNIRDESGNGHHGKIFGNLSFSPDRFNKSGNAFFMDGKSFIEVKHDTMFNSFPISVNAWFKSNNPSPGHIINNYVATSWNGWTIYIEQKGSGWYLRNRNDIIISDYGNPKFESIEALNDNKWHMLTFVVDDKSGRLYVDGKLEDTQLWNGLSGSFDAPWPVRIGMYVHDSLYFNGHVDDIGVWSKTLTEEEIQRIYNGVHCAHPDFATLDSIYILTNGDNWKNNTGWKDRYISGKCDPCNGWYGVSCKNGRVDSINFFDNKLDGRLLNLKSLEKLRFFSCRDNLVKGQAPEVSENLELEVLDLRGNEFTNKAPNISKNVKLKYFDISFNKFTDSFPSISNHKDLVFISCLYNQMIGPLPNLANNPNLINLSFGHNSFSGNIPAIVNCVNLELFECHNNSLTGSIPDISKNTKIKYFYCYVNQLTGEIPSLKNNINLEVFSCGNNSIQGQIPNLDANVQLGEFSCSTNLLSGSIPDLKKLTRLHSFDCSNNKLTGNIPDLSNQQDQLVNGWDNFTFSNNDLSGCYNNSICNFKNIPISFINNPKLPFKGDHKPFCSGTTQIGAPCDNGKPADGSNDVIDQNCNCVPGCRSGFATLSGANSICPGATATWTASGGNVYKWNTGTTTASITVNAAGTYTVTVTDSNGCTASSSQSLMVSPPVIASVTGNNSICTGNSTTLTASGGNYYSWSNGSTSNSITVSPVSAVNYTVTVVDSTGCFATASKTMQVIKLPVAKISGGTEICPGGNTTLFASGGSSYLWSNGSKTNTTNINAPGKHVVTVTDTNGCTVRDSVTVITLDTGKQPIPKDDTLYVDEDVVYDLDLLANDILFTQNHTVRYGKNPGNDIRFTSQSSDGKVKLYAERRFTEAVSMTYEICDQCDNCASANLLMLPEKLKTIIQTTLITPLESANNTLQFSDVPISDSELWVYNRWGQQVFHAKGYQNDWDADGVPGGVYYYVFKVYGFTIKKALTVVK